MNEISSKADTAISHEYVFVFIVINESKSEYVAPLTYPHMDPIIGIVNDEMINNAIQQKKESKQYPQHSLPSIFFFLNEKNLVL